MELFANVEYLHRRERKVWKGLEKRKKKSRSGGRSANVTTRKGSA